MGARSEHSARRGYRKLFLHVLDWVHRRPGAETPLSPTAVFRRPNISLYPILIHLDCPRVGRQELFLLSRRRKNGLLQSLA